MAEEPKQFELLLFPQPELAAELLTEWAWLLGQHVRRCRPVAFTLFGDCFVETPEGPIHYLNIVDGEVSKIADSRAQLDKVLKETPQGRDYLQTDMAEILHCKGLALKEGECFGYKVHPALGAPVGSDTMKVFSMRVYLSVMGQLMRQYRNGPDQPP